MVAAYMYVLLPKQAVGTATRTSLWCSPTVVHIFFLLKFALEILRIE
jgi:hypothetical protein